MRRKVTPPEGSQGSAVDSHLLYAVRLPVMLLKTEELMHKDDSHLSALFSTDLPRPLQANPQSPHLHAVCLICYSCAV